MTVLIAGGIAAYFVGTTADRTKLQDAHSQLNALQSTNALLGANMWISRATVALDNRNFGVANESVSKAVKELSVVDSAAIGLDSTKLASLQKQAGAIKISIVTNLQPERNQLLHLADAINVLAGQAARNVPSKP